MQRAAPPRRNGARGQSVEYLTLVGMLLLEGGSRKWKVETPSVFNHLKTQNAERHARRAGALPSKSKARPTPDTELT